MNTSLLLAAFALAAWVIFAWLVPVGIPAIHLLLAVGCTLFVHGWALRKT